MNALNSSNEAGFIKAKRAGLLGTGLDALCVFSDSVSDVQNALETLRGLGDDTISRRLEKMSRQLETLEPSVTMVGQVKSGKTSLINALIGAPDLLPVDVNPWTSVITSLHLHPEEPGFENSATFTFFERDEWDRLILGGGRIGELARRAGADEELEKIKQQVSDMREKSRRRLGRNFEVLLGQQRDYGYFDKELIERYVCSGDETPNDMQECFADITKSAHLHMQRPALPLRLCVRDTPGVNDTFMMREQITMRAMRDSQICVVVLSAHQALSSADMALIRLISQVKSRDVIIFVNRIDELSDPTTQIPQIRESIAVTLNNHDGPKEAAVIFGSAFWGANALQSKVAGMPASSAAALANWSQHAGEGAGILAATEDTAWRLSGVPALQDAISQRVAQGIGTATLQRVGASAMNLASGLVAANKISANAPKPCRTACIDSAEAHARIAAITDHQRAQLRLEFDAILASFAERVQRAQESFLDRATASLTEHLERHGDQTPWRYDPAGLRVMLSASHKVLVRNSQSAFDKATKAAAADIMEIYAQAFALGGDTLEIARPRAPHVPVPVSLAGTIALDLSSSWWRRWWLQRRGSKAHAESFYELIKSETTPIIAELRDEFSQSVRDDAIALFDGFLSEQLAVFERLDHMRTASPAELEDYLARNSSREKRALLAKTMATLNAYAAS